MESAICNPKSAIAVLPPCCMACSWKHYYTKQHGNLLQMICGFWTVLHGDCTAYRDVDPEHRPGWCPLALRSTAAGAGQSSDGQTCGPCRDCLFYGERINGATHETLWVCCNKAHEEDYGYAVSPRHGCTHFRVRPGHVERPQAAMNDGLVYTRCMDDIEHATCPACGRNIMVVAGRDGRQVYRKHVSRPRLHCEMSGQWIRSDAAGALEVKSGAAGEIGNK
jgi:hypothetical protein